MDPIKIQFPEEYNSSFIVFREKGQFFPCPWHFHPEFELVLVLESTGRRMIGDHIGHFQKDDLVFMGPMLPHIWVNDSKYINGKANYQADALGLHFEKDFLGDQFFEAPDMEEVKNILGLAKRGMAIKGKTRIKIIEILKRMPDQKGFNRLFSLMTILKVLSSSSEYNLLTSPDFKIQKGNKDRLHKVIAYIKQNFNEDISLQQVAELANMGVTTFSIYFKKSYRMTFVQYLNNLRIGHACKLLSEENHSVGSIAYSCGFNTLANFNRQFKKHKGMTPTKFRKKLVIHPSFRRFEKLQENKQDYLIDEDN